MNAANPQDSQRATGHPLVVGYVYNPSCGIFSYLSTSIQDWLGMPAAQLVDNPDWLAHVAASCRAEVEQAYRAENGTGSPLRFQLTTADGQLLHVLDTPLPSAMLTGRRIGHWVDITPGEPGSVSQGLAGTEIQDFVNDLADIYYRADREGRLVKLSGTASDLLGIPAEQLIGNLITDYYVDPADRTGFLQALQQQGRVHGYEIALRRMDGRAVWVSVNARLLHDSQGEIDGVEGLAREITVQKEIQDALREERDFSQTILNTIGSVVVVLNRRGEIVGFNAAAERLSGHTFGEVMGRPIWDVLVPDEQVEEHKGLFERLAGGEYPITYENEWLTRSGERLLLAWSNACVTDKHGAVSHVVATGIDITEQRRSLQALQASEERFRELAESIRDVFWLGSPDWQKVYYISPAYEAVWGDPCESVYRAPLSWTDRIHPDEREAIINGIADLDLSLDEVVFPDYRICRDDGSIRWISARAYPIHDENGKPTRIAGIAEDVTERHKAEEQLRQSAVAFEHAQEAIMVMDANRQLTTVNQAFSTITGYPPQEAVGKSPLTLFGGDDDSYEGIDWNGISSGKYWQGEAWLHRADGERFPAWFTASPVLDERGTLSHYVCLFSDISSIKQSQRELDYLAHHDSLTRLPNRLLFNARLEHAVQQAHRQSSKVALLFIDLDHFKDINDNLGHSVGDKLLIDVANRLRALVREEDSIARLGGDEFIISSGELGSTQDAIMLADRIIQLIRKPFPIGEHQLHVGASIGISIYPEDGTDIHTLLRNADAAMYRAKEQGRDNYQFYTNELARTSVKRISEEHALRQALENGDLQLHYQPQVSLDDGRIVAAEAVTHWQHPKQGLIPINQYLPVAEKSGLILELDKWAIHTACQQARDWLADGLPIERVTTRISNNQIQRGNVRHLIDSALSATGLDARHLELELQESSVMRQEPHIFQSLEALRDLEVKITIDGFGAGRSSFRALRRLPVKQLKIDGAFLREAIQDPDSAAIIRAIVTLAHTLQLQTVAEGVDSRELYRFLQQLNCDAAQGRLFSHPLPARQFVELLHKDSLQPDP